MIFSCYIYYIIIIHEKGRKKRRKKNGEQKHIVMACVLCVSGSHSRWLLCFAIITLTRNGFFFGSPSPRFKDHTFIYVYGTYEIIKIALWISVAVNNNNNNTTIRHNSFIQHAVPICIMYTLAHRKLQWNAFVWNGD